jgi:transcriptional regulator with XRE-family HTH domain
MREACKNLCYSKSSRLLISLIINLKQKPWTYRNPFMGMNESPLSITSLQLGNRRNMTRKKPDMASPRLNPAAKSEVVTMKKAERAELFNGVSKEDAAAVLKEFRSAKYTQAQFIRRIGMKHIQYLSQFENAKMDWRRSEEYRAAIIEALGLTREVLQERLGIGRAELLSAGIELDAESQVSVQVLEVHQARFDNGISPETGMKVYIPRVANQRESLTAYQMDNMTRVSETAKNDGIFLKDIIVVDSQAEYQPQSLIASWDEDRQTMLISYANEPEEYTVFYSVDNKPPVIFKTKDLKPIGVIVWRGGALQQ